MALTAITIHLSSAADTKGLSARCARPQSEWGYQYPVGKTREEKETKHEKDIRKNVSMTAAAAAAAEGSGNEINRLIVLSNVSLHTQMNSFPVGFWLVWHVHIL